MYPGSNFIAHEEAVLDLDGAREKFKGIGGMLVLMSGAMGFHANKMY